MDPAPNTPPATVLITGANGFIGSALGDALQRRGHAVVRAVRTPRGSGCVSVGDIGPDTDWTPALRGVDHVIHTAARVHVIEDHATHPEAAYRAVNVDGTRRLAEQAAAAGVQRLVFLSSIKVNGETTGVDAATAFTAFDAPNPADAYARSKWAAEQALHDVAARTELQVTVVRPPLVYGPGVQANFARLVRLVARGLPLPLGAVDNRRSLAALDNLVDLLIRCLDHPSAAGQTFLASDGQDLATPELICLIARAMDRPARLLPMPPAMLRWGGALTGKSAVVARLLDSLRIDLAHTRSTLDWAPPVSPREAIHRAVQPMPQTARASKSRA
ncbi:SDR family oxidoreductase [Aquisalimonas sp.]|uniref:UDP-glucose 4-epimerase family protein n=1 Tax=Aquisalimonas sp. TaxID=1872621 RepID=UPI0025C4D670|nr:SDR family oxidoreductase [Aquisalimonas sp.]